ncbi:MAG: nicotinate-nucleotide--dimethylbenzimidazole phosphoribosyltransferase [bacterium]|nr:nicotinate-nucleotide--dimethylbenzimidazole phosphoribosyltransferase [bacterium]
MDKIKQVISKIKPLDIKLMDEAQRKLDNLTKPRGSLGRLEEFAKQVVGITGSLKPEFRNKVIFTMAGDHGVVEEGVSAFPQEVTPQMVYNFLREGAGINVLARHVGAKVIVIDMGVAAEIRNPKSEIRNFMDKKVGFGTKNMTKGPAMTREEAVESIENGIEVFMERKKHGIDILGTGDMGIGNTTPSSAVIAAFSGIEVEKVTGRGTGISDEAFENKVRVIKKALDINKPDSKDPIDVLAKVGGFEIGGLCGCVLGAAASNTPVVIDGLISTAGALIAYELCPQVKDYIFAAHKSVEAGHQYMLSRMNLNPILDLNMRLGEGTGAALGISVIEAGIKILNEMATFEDAGVSEEIK